MSNPTNHAYKVTQTVATQDYSPGDVITSNRPFVHVLVKQVKSIICDDCLAINVPLKRCGKCLTMFYCSKECQLRDWKCHKYECKYFIKLKQFDDEVLGNNGRLLLRLWLYLQGNPQAAQEKVILHNGVKRSYSDLVTHFDDLKNDAEIMLTFKTYIEYFTKLDIKFDEDELLKAFGSILINAFSIPNSHSCLPNANKLAVVLPIDGSAFDHSCVPNAAPHYEGIIFELRAMRHIKAGEEIYDYYISLDQPKEDRIKQLKECWYFDCSCQRCLTESDQDSIDYKRIGLLSDENIEWLKERNCNLRWKVLDEVEVMLDKIWPNHHPHKSKLMLNLLKHKMNVDENGKKNCVDSLIQTVGNNIEITHGKQSQLYYSFSKLIDDQKVNK